ncbi:megakaryocyte and platelet inhibitory receptor G6b isoform X4 [Callithrix jacchus]
MSFSGGPPRGPGESLMRRSLSPHPLGLGAQLPGLQGPVQRTAANPVGLFQRDPHRASPPALRWPPTLPGAWYPAAGAPLERGGLRHLFLQGPPRGREPYSASRAGGQGLLQGPGAYPRVRVSPAPDPAAGRWAGAGTGSFGPRLVAAQAPAPAADSTTPWICSTCESRAPESSKGGTAQDSKGPGPGTEPSLCGSGPPGPQQAPTAVHSGPY